MITSTVDALHIKPMGEVHMCHTACKRIKIFHAAAPHV